MPRKNFGSLRIGTRTHRVSSATCQFRDRSVDLDVTGPGFTLQLVAVPLGLGPTEVAGDLVGRIWQPDENEMARYSDVFLEGGLDVDDERWHIRSATVACRGAAPENMTMTFGLEFLAEPETGGKEEKVSGEVVFDVLPIVL